MTPENNQQMPFQTWVDSCEKLYTHNSSTTKMRKAALDEFMRLGFPKKSQEDWRYTNVHPISNAKWVLASSSGSYDSVFLSRYLKNDPIVFVFMDGHLDVSKSRLDKIAGKIRFSSLAEILASPQEVETQQSFTSQQKYEDGFFALNHAMFEDGLKIEVGSNVKVDEPIHILNLSTQQKDNVAIFPRNIFQLQAGAKVSIIESFVGNGPIASMSNSACEIRLAERAELGYYRVQAEQRSSYHIGKVVIEQAEQSVVDSMFFAVGARLSRLSVDVRAKNQTKTHLSGFMHATSEGSLDQHCEINVKVKHQGSESASQQYFKGIADRKGRVVFNGTISIAENCSKVSAHQLANSLLLSSEAEVNVRPQLEIDNDDVECSHGATVSSLDPDEVFYLRSRGIPKGVSESMLCHGFVAEILSTIGKELHSQTAECRELIQEKMKFFLDGCFGINLR